MSQNSRLDSYVVLHEKENKLNLRRSGHLENGKKLSSPIGPEQTSSRNLRKGLYFGVSIFIFFGLYLYFGALSVYRGAFEVVQTNSYK